MIVAREHIQRAYARAMRLGASHDEAVRTVAQATGQAEATVRAVVGEEQAA